jgi:thiosulfate/3-mercaptopyruvate sulfurtransferase
MRRSTLRSLESPLLFLKNVRFSHTVPTLINASSLSSFSNVRLLDISPPEAYSRAHAETAIRFPVDSSLKDSRSPLHVIQSDLFEAICQELLITSKVHVVFMDNSSNMAAARAWWVFKYYGFDQVSILDGGWTEYVRNGMKVTLDVPKISPLSENDKPTLKAAPRSAYLATSEDLLHSIAGFKKDIQIIDSRTPGEFAGYDLRGNQFGGHVPGAVNIPHGKLLAPSGTLLPPEKLKQLFDSFKLDPSKPVITYCQSGMRASLAMVALQSAGFKQVKNYDASMKEWNNVDEYPRTSKATDQ